MENQSVGSLYSNAIDAAAPPLIVLIIGCLLIVFKMFDNYNIFSGIAFQIGITISSINTLVSNKISRDDWIYIGIMFLEFLISIPPTILVSLLWEKGKRMKMFCAILVVISLNNSVITGIPILSGIYDRQVVTKIAYLQMIPCVLLNLTVILIFFEFSAMMKPKDVEDEQNIKQNQSEIINNLKNFLQLTQKQQNNLAVMRKDQYKYIINQKIKQIAFMISMSIFKSLKSPLIISVFIGIILHFIFEAYKVQFPQFIKYLFEYQSFVSGPLGLLLIGMYIYMQAIQVYYQLMARNAQSNIKRQNYMQTQENRDNNGNETIMTSQLENISNKNSHQKAKEIVVRIIIVFYTGFFRHILYPVLFVLLSKTMAPRGYSYTDIEVNAVMLGQPPAVFTFVICSSYGVGEWLAGFEVVFGIIFSILVIPIAQLFSRWQYNV